MSDSSDSTRPSIEVDACGEEEDRAPHRRWYHPRPQPRCVADVAGFNYTYWLFVSIVVILILIP
jgi:hypothetical protein